MSLLVDMGGQAIYVPPSAERPFTTAERIAQRAVREEGLPATVVYDEDSPELPWLVSVAYYAIWRQNGGSIEESRLALQVAQIHRTRLAGRLRPFPVAMDPRVRALVLRAEEAALGDNYEAAEETLEVAGDLAEELGDFADAERSRVGAERLRVTRWFSDQNPRRERITFQRVLPVRNVELVRGTGREAPPGDRSWVYYVTPWDPEPGERYIVAVHPRRGTYILRGGSP